VQHRAQNGALVSCVPLRSRIDSDSKLAPTPLKARKEDPPGDVVARVLQVAPTSS
jgi:hypothetical protein